MRIVLGVSGGIAAYKAVLLLRLLREAGHEVRVVPTTASLEFVGRATWEALSGQEATGEVFDGVQRVEHVRIGQQAELVVVAPATANLIARAAAGMADDLLTATLLTTRAPVLLVPAMHTEMWQHPATQANVATLRARGVHLLPPASGRLTGADSGPGRMPEPAQIVEAALALVGRGGDPDGTGHTDDAEDTTGQSGAAGQGGIDVAVPRDLAGRHVVVSAGGTREPIDPVRFLGNRSTGRQGYALAAAAVERGASVTLVAANVSLPDPPGADVVRVGSAAELREAVRSAAADADAVVMAAAVADYRPADTAAAKLKKTPGGPPPTITLVENPDILAELGHDRLREGQVVVGFAAETGDTGGTVLDHGRAKALRKGADLLVVNAVGENLGFGTEDNVVTVLDGDGEEVARAAGTKRQVAEAVWDCVADLWS